MCTDDKVGRAWRWAFNSFNRASRISVRESKLRMPMVNRLGLVGMEADGSNGKSVTRSDDVSLAKKSACPEVLAL